MSLEERIGRVENIVSELQVALAHLTVGIPNVTTIEPTQTKLTIEPQTTITAEIKADDWRTITMKNGRPARVVESYKKPILSKAIHENNGTWEAGEFTYKIRVGTYKGMDQSNIWEFPKWEKKY